MTSSPHWFDLEEDGWRRRGAGRSLGSLLLEGIQNAFDAAGTTAVGITLSDSEIVIEDDGREGIVDPALVYTVFRSSKHGAERGRFGKGLKELISTVATRAEVETAGQTVVFDDAGRQVLSNQRTRGTLLRLSHCRSAEDLREAETLLRLTIAPDDVALSINGRRVLQPRRYLTLADCHIPTALETLVPVHLLYLRKGEGEAYLFERGIPVEPSPTPWHLNVDARIPVSPDRGHVEETFRRRLHAVLVETLVDRILTEDTLDSPWIVAVLSQGQLSATARTRYVQRRVGPQAVLGDGGSADETARQLGAIVFEPRSLHANLDGVFDGLLPRASEFVERAEAEHRDLHAAHPEEERALELYAYLGRELLGTKVTVRLFDGGPESSRTDALFEPKGMLLRINTRGAWSLRTPLSGASLALLFHELAHARSLAHGEDFVRALEDIAGRGAELLLREGHALLARYGFSQ